MKFKNYLLVGLILVVLLRCQYTTNEYHTDETTKKDESVHQVQALKKEVDVLLNKLDSLESSINRLQQQKNQDSVLGQKDIQTQKNKTPALPKKVNPAPDQKKTNPNKNKVADTLYNYYKNGAVSVKYHPAVEDVQLIQLIDLKGKVSYSFEQIRKSYSVSVSFKFHDNGAVKEAVVATNPGASLYMYRTTITFNTNNEPLWKQDTKYPERLDEIESPSYWDKKQKVWKKQEASKECAPVVY